MINRQRKYIGWFILFISLINPFELYSQGCANPKTVTKFATIIEASRYFLNRPNSLASTCTMTYCPEKVKDVGAAFELDYVDPGGTGMDGYPSGGIGGVKAGGIWYPGDPAKTGMPIRLSALDNSLKLQWKVSQTNHLDNDDKWQALINYIFDKGTATSEPVSANRDYDLVIQANEHRFNSGFDDKPKQGNNSYWYWARRTDGSIIPYEYTQGDTTYEYAVRYKFFQNSGDKNDKVQIKFVSISSIPSFLDCPVKPWIDASKDYLKYANLPQAELNLAFQKVADPNLYLKALKAGYEVYTGKSILRNDYFRVVFDSSSTTVLDMEKTAPTIFALHKNYPNPFNSETNIGFTLKKNNQINVSVFNLLGKKVEILVNQEMPAGNHYVQWNGQDDSGTPVTSGIYYYRLEAGTFSSTRKMLLMK